MTTLAFVGGASPAVSSSFTDRWVQTATGVNLPTTARIADNGNRPVWVDTAQFFVAGNGAARQLRLSIGGAANAITFAAAGSAQATGNVNIFGLFPNGGTQVVRIEASPTGSFYFGRAAGSSGSVDSYGTGFGSLAGQVEYYEVPNSPTAVTVAQANLENAVNVSWTAPSNNGGSAVTSYNVKWSYNSNMSGSTIISTGSTATTFKITNLSYGSTVYVQVAAINIVATNAGTSSVYSSTGSGFINPPFLPLNGWANFGTVTSNTFTLDNTVIPALVPETGMQRKGTSTATGGTYTTGAVGITKTYTDLIIGRQYILSGKAILLSAAPPANIYRFNVVGIGNGTSVTLTSTTAGATIPSYTFTATATTHTVEIELAETFTVSTVGIQENVAFYDFALTRVANDLIYRVQDNNENASLTEHFDLATQSVGAYWWVDRVNTTQFIQDFDYVVPSATFSDVVGDGNLYYNDIKTSFDTSAVINDITFNNVGRVASNYSTGNFDSYEVEWNEKDATSITNWGARRYDLKTNLYTETNRINIVPNPTAAYGIEYTFVQADANRKYLRAELSKAAIGGTGNLPVGTTQPTGGTGGFVIAAIATANVSSLVTLYTGNENIQTAFGTTSGYFPLNAGTQYTASVYCRTGVNNTSGATARVDINWINDVGGSTGNVSSTATTVGSTGWTRVTVTATAPASTYAARIAVVWGYSGANNTNYRYYSTCAQMEAASSASAFFTGDTTDDATYVYEWEGTPGQSRSIRYTNMMDTRTGELLTDFATPSVRIESLKWNTAQNPVIAAQLDIGSTVRIGFNGNYGTTIRTNLCVNPNFETNTTNWSAALGTVSRVTTTPQTGTYCLQMNGDGDSDLSAGYFRNTGLTIGTAYRAGMWVRVSTGTQALTMSLLAGIGASSSTSFTATTTWQFIQVPTVTATGATAQISLDGAGVSANVFVDSAIIETTSTYAGTFFDGNSTASGVTYAWTGTANASTSTATSTTLPPIYRVAGINHDINPERWMMTLQVAKV